MCCNVKTLSVCATCTEKLSEQITQQWCKEGRRKGVFGRCAMGVRSSEEEYRGDECRACVDVREAQMSQMEMSDFNVKRLGWRTYNGANPDDSDGGGYTW